MSASIDKEWRAFERDIIPASAGHIQRTELRRAFYTGAICMFALINNASALEDEAQALARMDLFHAEITAWMLALESGAV